MASKLKNIRLMDQATYDSIDKTKDDTLYLVDIPFSAYVTSSYSDGYNGYNIYSNGYVEQWGRLQLTQNIIYSVPLMIEMRDAFYNVQLTIGVKDGYTSRGGSNAACVSATSTRTIAIYNSSSYNPFAYIYWTIKGYKKET